MDDQHAGSGDQAAGHGHAGMADAAPGFDVQFDGSANTLESFWMPFTWNREFKRKPKVITGAKDMHYTTDDGRQVLDGTAGCGASTPATAGRGSSRRCSSRSPGWTTRRPSS